MLTRLLSSALVVVVLAAAPAATADLKPAEHWDAKRAAHLLRRAGFGGTPAQVEYLTQLGLDAAVDYLVDYEKVEQTEPDFVPVTLPDFPALREQMRDLPEEQRQRARNRLQALNRRQTEELRAWWLRRMVVTPRPFEEKMTLFWHGHFTTGEQEVRASPLLARQNGFLRKNALAPLRKLLVGISKDPAMLRYLDNASNRKGKPNENYARELMELFTMGEGHYTERDVKEAARALTGWTVQRGGEFREARRMHDDGEKTILGETGKFDGEDVIDIILKQRATPRYIATKLLRFFVQDDPPAELVGAVSQKLTRSKYDIRETMRAIFRSEAFYSKDAMATQIKSPVELIVATLRALEAPPADLFAMVQACRAMGQDLYQPPNVKGWDGGREWITTATLFTRYNFAAVLVHGTGDRSLADFARGLRRRAETMIDELKENMGDYPGLEIPPPQVESSTQPPYDPLPIVEAAELTTPEEIVRYFARRLLPVELDDEQADELRTVLVGGSIDAGDVDLADWKPTRARLRAMLVVLMSMPEYQLN